MVGQNTSCKAHKVCISLWPMGWDDGRSDHFELAGQERQTCQPPKHANLEMLKKSPKKPGDWDVKPGDFQNMC